MSQNKRWRVVVYWELAAELEVEAANEDDAIQKIYDSEELPDGTYIEDSLRPFLIEEVHENGD